MIANMKFQIENPALLNSRFVFHEFLYLDVNFHQLNLMRGSSYLPLPDWLVRKKTIVNWNNWNKAPMRLWQTQLNYAVFCALSAWGSARHI